jgi:hypothetical protein
MREPAGKARAPNPDDEDEEEQQLVDGLAEEESDTPEEADEGPPEDAEEEPEPYAKGRFAADDAKVKLDDGKVITIAELRKGTLLQSDYSRKTQALAEERKVVEQHVARVREVEQALKQQEELIAELWQEVLSTPPDPAMLDPNSGQFDVVTYMKSKEEYERKGIKTQKFIANYQARVARQAQEENQSRLQIRSQEAERLYEAMPELRKPETYQQFWAKAVETVADYGYTPEDLDQVDDHRTYLVLRDAMAFRDLKRKVAMARTKVAGRPPVLQGSARRSSETARTHETKTALARLNQTGSVADGIAAMVALDKARNR